MGGSRKQMMDTVEARRFAVDMLTHLAHQRGARDQYDHERQWPDSQTMISSVAILPVKARWYVNRGLNLSISSGVGLATVVATCRPVISHGAMGLQEAAMITDVLNELFLGISWSTLIRLCDGKNCVENKPKLNGEVFLPLCDLVDGRWICPSCQEEAEKEARRKEAERLAQESAEKRKAKEEAKQAERARWVQRREAMSERAKMKPSLRFQVLERDGYICRACGRGSAFVVLHVDHVIPVSKGGKTVIDNLQTLCEQCNLGKSARMPLSSAPDECCINQ